MRTLGKTDILVTPIGLGVMELSGGGGLLGHMFPVIPQEEKNAIIKAALDGASTGSTQQKHMVLEYPSDPWQPA